MQVVPVLVPYHLGEPDLGPALGVAPMHEALAQAISLEAPVRVDVARRASNETARCFAVIRATAEAVAAVRKRGAFPWVLSGNCNAAVGAIAAVAQPGLGVVWLDAHGDLNTPDTTTSGYFEGMPLAITFGRCWTALARAVPGWRPVAEDHAMHVGGRDWDEGELRFLESSPLQRVSVATLKAGGATVAKALARLPQAVRSVYLHVDVDVLDIAEGMTAHNAVGGGPTVDEVAHFIAALAKARPLAGIGFASYGPEHDRDGRALRSIARLLAATASAFTGTSRGSS